MAWGKTLETRLTETTFSFSIIYKLNTMASITYPIRY